MAAKKNILSTLMAIGLVCGCSEERKEYDNKMEHEDAQVSQTPWVLIGKEVRTYHYTDWGMLYFATEGLTNKISFIAHKGLPCARSEAKFFEAKIGDKKMPNEWRKVLSHRDEDNCTDMMAAEHRLTHALKWYYVRED